MTDHADLIASLRNRQLSWLDENGIEQRAPDKDSAEAADAIVALQSRLAATEARGGEEMETTAKDRTEWRRMLGNDAWLSSSKSLRMLNDIDRLLAARVTDGGVARAEEREAIATYVEWLTSSDRHGDEPVVASIDDLFNLTDAMPMALRLEQYGYALARAIRTRDTAPPPIPEDSSKEGGR